MAGAGCVWYSVFVVCSLIKHWIPLVWEPAIIMSYVFLGIAE